MFPGGTTGKKRILRGRFSPEQAGFTEACVRVDIFSKDLTRERSILKGFSVEMEGEAVPVSPLMQALNDEALSRARKMLSKKFSEVSSLDDISSSRTELQAKLSSAEAKLRGAVQGEC